MSIRMIKVRIDYSPLAFMNFMPYCMIFMFYLQKQKLNKELINQKFELQTKSDELDKTNKLKDKLFAMIGHDLRSPVTNILDQLTLWESEKQNEKFKLNKDSILKLKVNIVNLQLILSNLLQWASSQIISSTPNIQKINLKQITNGILRQLNENLKQKDIKIINYLYHLYLFLQRMEFR